MSRAGRAIGRGRAIGVGGAAAWALFAALWALASQPSAEVAGPRADAGDASQTMVPPFPMDSSATLDDVVDATSSCRSGQASEDFIDASESSRPCVAVLYVWSPLMPLSEIGLREAAQAAGDQSMPFLALPASELLDTIARPPLVQELSREMIARGATVHYPSVLVLRGGSLVGSSIVGYKTRSAYRRLLKSRLSARSQVVIASPDAPDAREPTDADAGTWYDRDVPRRAGAYIRALPGAEQVLFEAGKRNYVLSLADGAIDQLPGFVDPIPTPDARYLVTPAPERRGLQFFSWSAVRTKGVDSRPAFLDRKMVDHYPSVALLVSRLNNRLA